MTHSARLKLPNASAMPKSVKPVLQPVANQIRSYYKNLHSEYMQLQRQEALARVQHALEPLAITLISTCNG